MMMMMMMVMMVMDVSESCRFSGGFVKGLVAGED